MKKKRYLGIFFIVIVPVVFVVHHRNNEAFSFSSIRDLAYWGKRKVDAVSNTFSRYYHRLVQKITGIVPLYGVAHVRIGNRLSDDEIEYLQNRKSKVKMALEKILEQTFDEEDVPTIALVGSGGGYRAMLGITGSLVGMEEIGLLDASTYALGLSGSSWGLSAWTASGLPIEEFKERLIEHIEKGIERVSPSELKLMLGALATKYISLEPVSLVDLYGLLLANRLLAEFGNKRQHVHFSDFAERIKTGDWILPINTAVDGHPDKIYNPAWFEFSPFEIGSSEYEAYVPTWAFGRKFNEGFSVNFVPEVSLGFLMGTWGSAFAAHAELIWENLPVPKGTLKMIVENILIKRIAGRRLTAGRVFNYMKGMPGQLLSNDSYLRLVDGGIGHTNLAYIPVSGERPRDVDIIIFFDWSGIIDGVLALKGVQEYAQSRGLKLPQMDLKGAGQQTITVFKDEHDPTVPVIIYIPRFNDQKFWKHNKDNTKLQRYSDLAQFDIEDCVAKEECNTINFSYKKQAHLVTMLAEANVVINAEKIIETIQWVIEHKKIIN